MTKRQYLAEKEALEAAWSNELKPAVEIEMKASDLIMIAEELRRKDPVLAEKLSHQIEEAQAKADEAKFRKLGVLE